MLFALKVRDCQGSNLSQVLTAFETEAALQWKVGTMPSLSGIRFSSCYLVKWPFPLIYFPCTCIKFQGLLHLGSTSFLLPCVGDWVREGWSLEWRCVVYCFLSLKVCIFFSSSYNHLRGLVIYFKFLLHSSNFLWASSSRVDLYKVPHQLPGQPHSCPQGRRAVAFGRMHFQSAFSLKPLLKCKPVSWPETRPSQPLFLLLTRKPGAMDSVCQWSWIEVANFFPVGLLKI